MTEDFQGVMEKIESLEQQVKTIESLEQQIKLLQSINQIDKSIEEGHKQIIKQQEEQIELANDVIYGLYNKIPAYQETIESYYKKYIGEL